MKRYFFVLGLFACAAILTQAQTHAPYPPFTAEQAKLGKQLIATTLEIRKGITNNSLTRRNRTRSSAIFTSSAISMARFTC